MKTVSARERSGADRGIGVKIVRFGPTANQMRTLGEGVAKHRAVQALLGKTRHRLLRIDLIDLNTEAKPAAPRPPDSFRAFFYDYTTERMVFATGTLARPTNLEVTGWAVQPLPSEEEFDEAARLVTRHADFAAAVRDQRLVPYQPMPPLIGESRPDGRVERAIAVGLMPREGMEGHEIVGVNMSKRNIVRFAPSDRGRGPEMSAAHNPICGQPNASQPTVSNAAGSVCVTVTQGGSTVWKFLVVRPPPSSGTNGSGIELRYVDYRCKRLLYRAHVP